jgi:CheY-like chemotaxis protein
MSKPRRTTGSRASESFAGFRFLVVDDHKFSRDITIETLKWLDVSRIAEAADAGEAIALLKGAAGIDRDLAGVTELARRLELSDDRLFGQGKFDCVITDYSMAPLNGLHLLKAIRTGKAQCARDTPVLLLTGYSDDFLIAAALNLDVNAFVLKPISRVIFNEKLAQVMMRPITARPVEAYEAVDISDPDTEASAAKADEVDGFGASRPKFEPGDRVAEELPMADLMVLSVESELRLGEDMILGEDVEGPGGKVFLHRGTRLTPVLLEKLDELREIGQMPGSLKVYR